MNDNNRKNFVTRLRPTARGAFIGIVLMMAMLACDEVNTVAQITPSSQTTPE